MDNTGTPDAVNAMQPLVEPIKSQVLAKAEKAFTRALQCIAGISALCSLLMAGLTLKLLTPKNARK